ncbi:sulfite exporter TauE/SafE family protein [Corallococcus exercitus]|uniref:sulfite exporter TauE/SafE family protein n=1 Tax=Corallococcus exercitus TaxID=2316736 RepID=UPI0035D4D505
MLVLGLSLAALVGLALGLLGGGGSILTVPIFVYVLGLPAKESIAMGLAVVGVTSLLGAAGHWRAGNVNVRAALGFGGLAMAGTWLGTRLSVHVPGAVQLVVLALVMLVAAFFMFRNARGVMPPAEDRAPESSLVLTGGGSLAVGMLTGLVGVGGGFLIVPALVLFAGLSMKQAVGSSLLVIALNSFVGFAGYLGQVRVPWGLLGEFTALAAAGILVGTALVRFISQAALKRAFSLVLVLMGAFILFKNRGVLLDSAVHAAPAAAAAVQR